MRASQKLVVWLFGLWLKAGSTGKSKYKNIYIYPYIILLVNTYQRLLIHNNHIHSSCIEVCTMAMATSNTPQLITDWYHSCMATFAKITTGIDVLVDSSSHEAKERALQLIQDQIGRLRVWAGNMGAHHPAGSRMSLDYKLKEASHIHNTVVELLEELNTTLESAYIYVEFDIQVGRVANN